MKNKRTKKVTIKFDDNVPLIQRAKALTKMALDMNPYCMDYPSGEVKINGKTGVVIVPHPDRNKAELGLDQ